MVTAVSMRSCDAAGIAAASQALMVILAVASSSPAGPMRKRFLTVHDVATWPWFNHCAWNTGAAPVAQSTQLPPDSYRSVGVTAARPGLSQAELLVAPGPRTCGLATRFSVVPDVPG